MAAFRGTEVAIPHRNVLMLNIQNIRKCFLSTDKLDCYLRMHQVCFRGNVKMWSKYFCKNTKGLDCKGYGSYAGKDNKYYISCTACCLQLILKYLPGSERIACFSVRSQEEWSGGADSAGWSGTAEWTAEGHPGETAGCIAECFGFRYQSPEDTSLLRHKVQKYPAVPGRFVVFIDSYTARN